MDPKLADQIMHQVEADYDTIADHFSSTRHNAWPEFGSLSALITTEGAEHSKLLDIGCGNGRLAAALPSLNYTGLDLSQGLLDLAKQKFPQYQFVHGSMLQLPFADAQFDYVACVAALQHIPSAAYRQQAVTEMARVLKPGGHLFMLNWNLNGQAKYQTELAPVSTGYDEHDYLISWKTDQGELKAKRYYHGFTLDELANLLAKAGLSIQSNQLGPDDRNLVTLATK